MTFKDKIKEAFNRAFYNGYPEAPNDLVPFNKAYVFVTEVLRNVIGAGVKREK